MCHAYNEYLVLLAKSGMTHSAILEFVPNGVGVVWASLLKKPLEVVYR
jgi:hypothetical protein